MFRGEIKIQWLVEGKVIKGVEANFFEETGFLHVGNGGIWWPYRLSPSQIQPFLSYRPVQLDTKTVLKRIRARKR